MTKKVRIENADTSNYRVVVQIWDKGLPNDPPMPDTLAKEIELSHPTAMTGDDVYLTNTRYIVIKELPPGPQPLSGGGPGEE
jgi:hypothetical protein